MRSKRTNPKLNTSSLPDIVFMILFFFMAIGMFPSPQAKVENDITIGTGDELDNQSNYIHVRVSKDQIQLGYEVIELADLTELLTKIKKKNVVILHIDDDTPIGLVNQTIKPAILDSGKTTIYVEVEVQDEEESGETEA